MTLRPTEPCADAAADHADATAAAAGAAHAATAAHAAGAADAAAAAHAHETREPLDPELERRIAALESGAGEAADFDAASWLWMVLLGIVAPLALLVWGWFGR